MSALMSIGADHPALPGHFPGRPIVPGVVILDALIGDLCRLRPDLAPCGVKKLKFTRALAPGEKFGAEWEAEREGRIRFRAFVGEEALATGQLLVAKAG